MKKIISLSIDSEVYKEFSDLSHSIGRSTSSMIEDYMRLHLESQRGIKYIYPELLKKENKNAKTKSSKIN